MPSSPQAGSISMNVMVDLAKYSNDSFLLNLGPNLSGKEDTAVPEDQAWELASKCLVGIFLSLVIFSSIAGNLLVCLAIYTDRRLRKLGNLFLVSLALADLFVASLVESFALANDLMGYWMFGPQFCDTWIAFDVMCSTSSILNLCAISLDRFIHIKDPLSYGRWMTKRVVLACIAGIWLLSGLISFLPISLGWHKPKKISSAVESPPGVSDEAPQLPSCALDLTPVYAVVSSTISFCVPCLVMVALYTRLYLYARKHVRNIRAVTKPNLNSRDDVSPEEQKLKKNGKLSKGKKKKKNSITSHQSMDHKAAITLGIIMGVFLICWVPFFCINIIAAFCKTCISETTFKCLTWLGYLNSALNPVIYSIFNTEFREAFRRILVTYVRGECCPAEYGWCAARNGTLVGNGSPCRKSRCHSNDGMVGGRWSRRGSIQHIEAAHRIEAPGESSGGATEI